MKICLLAALSLIFCLQVVTMWAQQDYSNVEIKETHVAGSVYMLEGEGGNIGVSVGPEATIIAHDNVRKRLSGEWKPEGRTPAPPAPKEALPVITFDKSLSVFFNGEEIRLIHYPHGHTDGDSIIYFTRSKVVHTGDHFIPGYFPFIDIGGGGEVESFTRNVESLIQIIPADAKIIPGHGPLAGIADLKDFHKMLIETVAIVRERMKAGKSLEQIRTEGLPEKWESWGRGYVKTRHWIQNIYQSLSAQNQP